MTRKKSITRDVAIPYTSNNITQQPITQHNNHRMGNGGIHAHPRTFPTVPGTSLGCNAACLIYNHPIRRDGRIQADGCDTSLCRCNHLVSPRSTVYLNIDAKRRDRVQYLSMASDHFGRSLDNNHPLQRFQCRTSVAFILEQPKEGS